MQVALQAAARPAGRTHVVASAGAGAAAAGNSGSRSAWVEQCLRRAQQEAILVDGVPFIPLAEVGSRGEELQEGRTGATPVDLPAGGSVAAGVERGASQPSSLSRLCTPQQSQHAQITELFPRSHASRACCLPIPPAMPQARSWFEAGEHEGDAKHQEQLDGGLRAQG